MSVYELKYDELQHKVFQYGNKAICVYATTTEDCKADLDFRCRNGEIYKIGYSCRAVGNWSVSGNDLSGIPYTWSDMPVTAYQTHLEGSGVPRPYFYNNCELSTSKNNKVCYYVGKDSSDRPCIDYLAYNETSQQYVNAGFDGFSKYDGVLGFQMGNGFLTGLSPSSIFGHSVVGSDSYAIEVEIITNVPLFDSEEHARAWCENDITTGLLNTDSSDPEEEYKEQFDFWYIKNKWGHNTRNVSSASNTTKNYRFYPKRRGIAFVKHIPTAAEPYDRILVNYSNYEAYYAAWGDDDDEDFSPNPVVTTHFLTKSISFGASNYYTKFDFDTNIPLWDNQEDADDYFNGLKDISEASNYAYICRQDDSIINPDMPGTDIDESTELGTNGIQFGYGSRLYAISNSELSALFTEVFTPANFDAILDGTKLFGSNNMEAISGVMYIPLADLEEICGLGALANIKIGSWTSSNAQGRRIINNNKTISCGTFFFNRIYQDFRDYEPYNLLFFNGPFVGCHQLTISKYIDKTIEVQYNIDVTTGGIVCKLLADNLLLDIFDGTCGASKPFSATDNNAYINNIVSAITGASASASGSIEGITNSVGSAGNAIKATSAAAGVASGVGIALTVGGAAASGIYTGYQIKNAVDNPPQMHRGNLAGNLGYNLNTKPTFLLFTKRTVRPENELAVVGYPSSHGGKIGQFSGFLSCSAVKLADFDGTEAERAEIMEILRGGIYL